MKVFMLIKRLRYSGAYKMFMWVAKTLANRGVNVTVMTFMPNEVCELPLNLKWIRHDELETKSLFEKVRVIRREIKNINPDVSVSFLLDANVYNTLACIGLRTKSVICERNDPFKPGYNVLKFWKPLFRFADGAVFQLPKVAKYYNNIKGKTAIIPNPVQETSVRVLPVHERKKIVITLGRLDMFQKRQDVLIKAFCKFHESYSDYQLNIYGKGPDAEKIQEIINSNNANNYIVLKGETLHPQEVCRMAMIFVLSSDFEGIPNALIEAMSIGLPCVSTDCRPGGARLLIDNGKNGFIVPAGDSEALAKQIEYLASDMYLCDFIGQNAAKISEQFSEDTICGYWIEYLDSIVNSQQ